MIYFTSDTHFFHDRLRAAIRPQFATTEQMNAVLIHNINKIVRKQDTLFHLGDFGGNDRMKNYRDQVKGLRDQIVCRDVRLVYGNHDSEKIADVFDWAGYYFKLRHQKRKYILHHYPYAFWDRSFAGSISLHGHLHNEYKDFFFACMPGARIMDVGIDSARVLLGEMRPFSIDEVDGFMLKRPGFMQITKEKR